MNTNRAPKRRGQRGLALLAISVLAALVVPAAGWADSMTLAVPATPVQEIGGQVSWTAAPRHLHLLRMGGPDRRFRVATASLGVADRPRRHAAASGSTSPQATPPPPSCVAACQLARAV